MVINDTAERRGTPEPYLWRGNLGCCSNERCSPSVIYQNRDLHTRQLVGNLAAVAHPEIAVAVSDSTMHLRHSQPYRHGNRKPRWVMVHISIIAQTLTQLDERS